MTKIEDRVARGAAYLDGESRRYPNWIDVLDPDRLNVDDGYRCVFGQLHRAAHNGWGGFNNTLESFEGAGWLERRGFAVPGTGWTGWLIGGRGSRRFARRRANLNAAWRDLVAERRAARVTVSG